MCNSDKVVTCASYDISTMDYIETFIDRYADKEMNLIGASKYHLCSWRGISKDWIAFRQKYCLTYFINILI